MHLLVTRPHVQSVKMKRQLENIGCRVSIDPLLDIEPVPYNGNIYQASSALIVTSPQASLQIAGAPGADKSVPVYVVGPASAAPLKGAGFDRIYAAKGNAESLLKLILNNHAPADGLLTYLSGWHITQDLACSLALRGYAAQRVVCYKANPARKMDEQALFALKQQQIDAVMFLSARTAQCFIDLCKDYNLMHRLKTVTVIAFSDKIARILPKNTFKQIVIPRDYTVASVIETIRELQNQAGKDGRPY